MPTSVLALVIFAAMGSAGVSLLGRVAPELTPFERFVYGLPLGTVLASLLVLGLACLVGLSATLVVVVAGLAACLALLGHRRKEAVTIARPSALAALALGVVALHLLLVVPSALEVDEKGLWAGGSVWGDWAQHLGDVASFAYGDNFPPTHPRLSGQPFAYHYLTSITAAGLVALGADPVAVLPVQSLVYTALVALGVVAFARRLTGSPDAAALTALLFFLGGGLGWTISLVDMLRSHEVAGTLLRQPWDAAAQRAANFRWLNVDFALILPQRAWIYGLPLALLAFTLVLPDRSRLPGARAFALAGAVLGLLPFAHLGTLLGVALIMPFLAVLFPSRRWVLLAVVWAAIAVPQFLVQQGGGLGAAGAFRWAPGWVASPDVWVWFWLKNLGAFLPLLAIAWVERSVLDASAKRFLLAFMPVFVIGNLVVFQPWDWDNTKVLVFWYLAACVLVAALVAQLWRRFPSLAPRTLLIATLATLVGSGALQTASAGLGRDRALLLTRDELDFGRRLRDVTAPRALFVVGLQHNHPVSMVAGRRVVMGYPGWMWSQGVPRNPREQDVRAMFLLAPDAPALLRRYGVDYLVIGPEEKRSMHADPERFRVVYPSVLKTATYEVFDVRRPEEATTSSSEATSGAPPPVE